MKVPLIKPDLPALDDIRGPLEEILGNGRITNFGRFMQEFERECSAYLGGVHAVALSSGTAGLVFSLFGLGVKPGDKVILPSFTFMATAQAILLTGAEPLFAEIDEDLCVSPDDVAALLDQHPDAGAVFGVHMYGLPAKVDRLRQVVDEAGRRRGRKIPLLFDAAHAFGAETEGRRVGGFGDAEIFSLSVTKVMVTVEGGLVTTHDADLADRIRKMRNYGVLSNYNAHFPGMNGKMSEFHAIVGLHNVRRVESLMATRQEKARAYRDRIHGSTSFRVTAWPEGVVHTFKDFTVKMNCAAGCYQRDEIIRFLAERGVETRAYFFPPVHEQEYFRRFATRRLPKTECLSRQVLTLPFYTSMTIEEMDYVTEMLRAAEKEIL